MLLIPLDELNALAEQYNFDLSVPGLQGFFAALATAPTMIQPSTWLGFLVEEPEFESEQETNQVLGLLFRLYNEVRSQIRNPNRCFSKRPPFVYLTSSPPYSFSVSKSPTLPPISRIALWSEGRIQR
jgi:yecA family protein